MKMPTDANPFHVKFMDGTPVPPSYLAQVAGMIDDACEAEERICIDVLELHAEGLALIQKESEE